MFEKDSKKRKKETRNEISTSIKDTRQQKRGDDGSEFKSETINQIMQQNSNNNKKNTTIASPFLSSLFFVDPNATPKRRNCSTHKLVVTIVWSPDVPLFSPVHFACFVGASPAAAVADPIVCQTHSSYVASTHITISSVSSQTQQQHTRRTARQSAAK